VQVARRIQRIAFVEAIESKDGNVPGKNPVVWVIMPGSSVPISWTPIKNVEIA
jgi:hypothetical protein